MTSTEGTIFSVLRRLAAGGAKLTLPSRPIQNADMVSLLRLIQLHLPDRSSRVVQIIASNRGEGVSSVTEALARAATTTGNARVLICDAGPEPQQFARFGVSAAKTSLHNVAFGHASLDECIVTLPNQRISLCCISKPGEAGSLVVNLDLLDPCLLELRARFDLILVDSSPAHAGVLGPALARKADGVIMIMEAEHTRVPAFRAARTAIEVNGGKILGVVLNKRRFHLPNFIYNKL